jgi:hypothetical protein
VLHVHDRVIVVAEFATPLPADIDDPARDGDQSVRVRV